MGGFVERFNRIVGQSVILQESFELRQETNKMKKGKTIYFWLLLVASSVITTFISFAASVVGFAGDYFVAALVATMISILVNNFIFIMMLSSIRKRYGVVSKKRDFLNTIHLQILYSIGIGFVQNMVQTSIGRLSAVIPQLNVGLTIAISLLFTLVNVVVACAIFDDRSKVSEVMRILKLTLLKHYKALIFTSIIFVAVSYTSNIYYGGIVGEYLNANENINNIIHALLFLKRFDVLQELLIYFAVSFAILSYLEINIVVGAIHYYEVSSVTNQQKHRKKVKGKRK